MSRRKEATAESHSEPEIAAAVDQALANAAATQAEAPPSATVAQTAPREPGDDEEVAQKKWTPVKGYWRDNWKDNGSESTGVRIEADTSRNQLNTIVFNERPNREVLQILGENGFVEDDKRLQGNETAAFTRRMSNLRPVDDWKQADEVVVEVANALRAAHGMEPIDNFYISQRSEGKSPF